MYLKMTMIPNVACLKKLSPQLGLCVVDPVRPVLPYSSLERDTPVDSLSVLEVVEVTRPAVCCNLEAQT